MASKSDTPSPFEEFSRTHAVALLLALAFAAWRRSAWVCALAASLQFARLIFTNRGQYTPRGSFGVASTLTSLRCALVMLFALPKASLPPSQAAALAALILLLDGLDGAVARKRGEASVFGAYFDMETDALFVFMITVRLWLREGYGAWVLSAGILRYAYVLSVWLIPGSGREAPRSLLGRLAFLILAFGLIIGLALPGAIGAAGVLAGTVVVSASFARSYYFSHLSS